MPLIKKNRRVRTATLISSSILALFSIVCCTPYTVTFNDNVVYSPNTIRTEILEDPNLEGCLNQLLASSSDNNLENITLLACPDAEVSTINGLEVLSNLEQLELSNNNISDLSPLLGLSKLRLLSIRNNRISNVNALMTLPLLRFISLDGNNNISCRQLDRLQEKVGRSLNRPLICK